MNSKLKRFKSKAMFTIVGGVIIINPAFAQDAAPAPAPQQETATTLDTVTVTGMRSSLDQAMNIKRDTPGIVDAISAEDIGKFPDTNLAESLQRITGISIERRDGLRFESSGIREVRGAQQGDDGIAGKVGFDGREHQIGRGHRRLGGQGQRIPDHVGDARGTKGVLGQIQIRQRPLEHHSGRPTIIRRRGSQPVELPEIVGVGGDAEGRDPLDEGRRLRPGGLDPARRDAGSQGPVELGLGGHVHPEPRGGGLAEERG